MKKRKFRIDASLYNFIRQSKKAKKKESVELRVRVSVERSLDNIEDVNMSQDFHDEIIKISCSFCSHIKFHMDELCVDCGKYESKIKYL